MQNILKNKIFYYCLIPLLLAAWSIYNSFIVLPEKSRQYDKTVKQYYKCQPLIAKIITLAPEKLVQAKNTRNQFDYDKAIDKTARLCRISSSKIIPNIRGKIKQSKQTIQDATIAVKEIKVRQFAMFLSISLHLWPNLQCERLKLTKVKGTKNSWNANINYRYFY